MNDVKVCQNCRKKMNNDDKPQGIYLYEWDYDDTCICDECKSKLNDVPISTEEYMTITEISNTIGFLEAMIKLKEENIIEFQSRMSQFKTQLQQQENSKTNNTSKRCPSCGGTKFTPVRRKWSLLTGFMTNKVDLVCNNCGKKV